MTVNGIFYLLFYQLKFLQYNDLRVIMFTKLLYVYTRNN